MSEPASGSGRYRTLLGAAIGVGLIGGLWMLVARRQPELILPSPSETLDALLDLHREGVVVDELSRTVGRALSGVGMALGVGLVWGAVNGRSAWVSAITRPITASLLAFPPVIVVSLGLVWFGPGPTVTRLVIVAVGLPLIVVAVEEAIRNLDPDLLEMAAVFEVPRSRVVRHVVAPGIASPVAAVVAVTIGQALRIAVMAELLGASDGIGAEIALARANLETADLFAWALVMVLTVIVVELAILKPINNRLNRWRTAVEQPPRSEGPAGGTGGHSTKQVAGA